ncbi:MAG: hypothetical protein HYX57_05490 [Chloroflexi bacterium]|nr:hypothetical protein [Chloroflexota bacterium]
MAGISSLLLTFGGTVMALLLIAMSVAPSVPAVYGFLLVAPAVGLGALGLVQSGGSGVGRLGRVSGWITGIGAIAVLAVALYAIATDQFASTLGAADPLAMAFATASMAWMIGGVGVALAMWRVRSVSARGAWLILAGTVSAIVLGTLLDPIAPALSPLSALPFAIGWLLVGWGARGNAPRSMGASRSYGGLAEDPR